MASWGRERLGICRICLHACTDLLPLLEFFCPDLDHHDSGPLACSDLVGRLWFPLAKPSKVIWRIFSTVETPIVYELWFLLAKPSGVIWRIFSTVETLVVYFPDW